MRNLIVCLDGTWNTPDQMDQGRQVPSNVVKMARAVNTHALPAGVQQEVYYNTGVGTGGFIDRLVGGGTGSGITKNILHAYEWLIKNYKKTAKQEDRIFLFGFSRGAYTARSLAGLIGLCGLPKATANQSELNKTLKRAEEIYRIKDPKRRELEALEFKGRPANVHFIGVWDTVGALGVPTSGLFGAWTKRKSHFHDVKLGEHISNAYHAVAVNERRGPFKPTLWDPDHLTNKQTLVQAWFPGVHTNVGGGYADDGLSDRTLLWMIRNAERHGLEIDANYVDRRINPNWFGEIRDSMSASYKFMFWDKPKNRVIGSTNLKKDTPSSEFLHECCRRRWGDVTSPCEAPDNYIDVRPEKGVDTNSLKGKVPFLEEDLWEKAFNLPQGLDSRGEEKVA